MSYTRANKPIYRKVTLDEFGDVLDVNDMALFFHVGTPAINKMCREGKLIGAFKTGKTWQCHKDHIKEHCHIN